MHDHKSPSSISTKRLDARLALRNAFEQQPHIQAKNNRHQQDEHYDNYDDFLNKLYRRIEKVDNFFSQAFSYLTSPLKPYILAISQWVIWTWLSNLFVHLLRIFVPRWTNLFSWVTAIWCWFYYRVPRILTGFYRQLWKFRVTWISTFILSTFFAVSAEWSIKWLEQQGGNTQNLAKMLRIEYLLVAGHTGCWTVATMCTIPVLLPFALPWQVYQTNGVMLAFLKGWGMTFVDLIKQAFGAWGSFIMDKVGPDAWNASLLVASWFLSAWRVAKSILFTFLYAVVALPAYAGRGMAVVSGLVWTVFTTGMRFISWPITFFLGKAEHMFNGT